MSTYPATAALPQTGSIVSRWLLDEASGNRADSVGSNTLTDVNTVLAGTGYTNLGGTFDNSADYELSNSEYLSKTDTASLSITGNLSFSVLVNIESAPNNTALTFMSKSLAAGSQRSYQFFYLDSAGTKTLVWENSDDGTGANTTSVSVTSTLNTATWYLVTMTYTAAAGSLSFYVNGAQVGTTQTGLKTSIFNGTADFRLGTDGAAGAGTFYDGLQQDAILWNAALSTADWLSLYTLYTTAPANFGSPIFFT